jgi:type IV fimbrial biogenesis protein FimT
MLVMAMSPSRPIGLPRTPRARRMRGFTLIELMTTLGILIILLTVAAPQMRPLIALVQLRAASYDLTADLMLARSEALKRATTVSIAPRSAGSWSTGWSVTATGVTEVLSQRNALGSAISASTAPTSVTFDVSGRLANASGTVRFNLTDGQSNARCISLDPSGRPKTSTSPCPT